MVPVISSKPPQLAPSRRVGVCMGLPPPPEKPPRDGRRSAETRNGRAADTKSFIIISKFAVIKGGVKRTRLKKSHLVLGHNSVNIHF
jgi:hypothetical protein